MPASLMPAGALLCLWGAEPGFLLAGMPLALVKILQPQVKSLLCVTPLSAHHLSQGSQMRRP
jgi:hypothetical protein